MKRRKLLDGWNDLATIKHRSPGMAKRPPRVGRAPRRRDQMAGQEQFPRQTLPKFAFQQPANQETIGDLTETEASEETGQ